MRTNIEESERTYSKNIESFINYNLVNNNIKKNLKLFLKKIKNIF